MIRRLKLKILFVISYIFMIAVWIWGSFLFQNLLVRFFKIGEIADGELASNFLLAVNFSFFGISILIFSALFFRQMDKADKIKEKAEEARLMLFAALAHDLKTPITSILGYSKALADGIVSDGAKKTEYLRTISAKSQQMNELIDRLFEYVKLESAQNALHKTPCDVAEILRESVANLYTDFEERGFLFEIQIPEKSVEKNADPLEISRVFTNLLNNAIKHNPPATKIKIAMDENGKTTIADNGIEISKEIRSRIFEPFVSGDESRTNKNGSGLGLAIAKKIMEKHGGKLSLAAPFFAGEERFTKAFLLEF